eukprot:1491062-Pleurochrysis_carterae.AAC.1
MDADSVEGDVQGDTPESMSESEGPFPSRLVHRRAYEKTRREGEPRACVAAQRARRSVRRVSCTHSERSAIDRTELAHMPKLNLFDVTK